jgi:hypothetical protein
MTLHTATRNAIDEHAVANPGSACRDAIKRGDGEGARMWLAVWETSPFVCLHPTTTAMASAALMHDLPSLAMRIIHNAGAGEVEWPKLIKCSINECHSPAIFCWLRSEFKLANKTMWNFEVDAAHRLALRQAVRDNDCLAIRIWMRVSAVPPFVEDPRSAIDSSDLLWLLTHHFFTLMNERVEGPWTQTGGIVEALVHIAERCAEPVFLTPQPDRHSVSRAMAIVLLGYIAKRQSDSALRKSRRIKFGPDRNAHAHFVPRALYYFGP